MTQDRALDKRGRYPWMTDRLLSPHARPSRTYRLFALMTSKNYPELPGWTCVAPPRFYVRSSDDDDTASVLLLNRVKLYSTDSLIDQLVSAAAASADLPLKPLPDGVATGTIDDAIQCVPEDTRRALAARDPPTLARIASTIDQPDPRLHHGTLDALHIESGSYAWEALHWLREHNPPDLANYLINLPALTDRCRFDWLAYAELGADGALPHEPRVFATARHGGPLGLDDPTPVEEEQARATYRSIAPALATARDISMLYDATDIFTNTVLVGTAHQLAMGNVGPLPPIMYFARGEESGEHDRD